MIRILSAFLFLASAVSADVVKVCVPDGKEILKCGTVGTFRISVMGKNGKFINTGVVICRLFDDHFKLLSEKKFELAKGNPIEVCHTLNEPGFLKCSAVYGKKRAAAVIGYDPYEIKASQIKPDDFEEFWKTEKEAALKIPLDVKLEKLARLSNKKYTGYAVDFANVNGTRMYGYLSIPTASGVHPAGILLPGMGPGFAGIPDEYDRSTTIVLALNVHPVFMGGPDKFRENYKKFIKEEHYYFHGLPELRKYVFCRVMLGICRGVKMLRERPEWNGTHLAVSGTSQGGGLTIAAAALNAEYVTAAAVNVPAFGEMVDGVRPASNRWQKVRARAGGKEIVPYIDAVNFTPLIRCPMIWSVGFLDESCYPRTVFASYNRLKSEKSIWIGPRMTHASSKEYASYRRAWLKQQLSKPLSGQGSAGK